MTYPEKRYAIVLDASLSCGLSHNTATHLAAQLGALYPALRGTEVSDASGVPHAGIPIYPNVILKASQQEIRARLVQARDVAASKGVLVIDYTEYGFTTATEAEYHHAVSSHHEETIRYFGFLLFGAHPHVRKLTRGLRLWDQCGSQQASQLKMGPQTCNGAEVSPGALVHPEHGV